MIFNSTIEQRFMEEDFDTFPLADKNLLIYTIANSNGLMYSDLTADYLLNYHRDLKIAYLDEICESKIITGFTASNGHAYRLNRDDQLNMMGVKDELRDDETITAVNWKTEDQGYIEHTREEWMQVFKEALAHKRTVITTYNQLKAQVKAAVKHADILTINWA
jgi:hypothetical protein